MILGALYFSLDFAALAMRIRDEANHGKILWARAGVPAFWGFANEYKVLCATPHFINQWVAQRNNWMESETSCSSD